MTPTVRLAAVALAVGLVGCAAMDGMPSLHTFAVTSPRPATIGGELYRPAGPGPFPAVVVLHGCGGVGVNMHDWGQWLRAEGYAAFVLDSFAGRGLGRLCGDPSPLTWRERSPDVYAAAAYLKSLPYVAGDRLAALGFSHGGGAVLWAGTGERQYPGTRLRAFVAFYPGCGEVLAYEGTAPLLLLLGGKDDWAPLAPCQLMADLARQAGRPVTAILYPEARHAFDAWRLRGVVFVPDGRRGRGATIAHDPAAYADSLKRVRQFLRTYLAP